MPNYTNFYETVAEAEMRLLNTIVMYDNEPYYVLAITNHKGDGIFRVYLDHLGHKDGPCFRRNGSIPYEWMDEPGMSKGKKMDEWLDKNPDKGIIRKMANSSLFNKYRPFPLGMCNTNGKVLYVERQPTRHTQQGLTGSMLSQHLVEGDSSRPSERIGRVDIFSKDFYNTLVGKYPSADVCLSALLDPQITNTGVAFHRNFALTRGPVGLILLAYKSEIVGVLPNDDFSLLLLADKFKYVLESIEELHLFKNIKTR